MTEETFDQISDIWAFVIFGIIGIVKALLDFRTIKGGF